MDNNLDVYFDFIEVGADDIEIGVIIENDGEVEDSYLERFEGIKSKGNNYHFSILAWRHSVNRLHSYIDEEGDSYDKIVFHNQNKLIFTWAESGKFPIAYEKGIGLLYNEISSLLSDYSFDFSFKTIKGKDNKVKKILKKRNDKKESTSEYKMNFDSLVPKAKTNIINFYDKKVN